MAILLLLIAHLFLILNIYCEIMVVLRNISKHLLRAEAYTCFQFHGPDDRVHAVRPTRRPPPQVLPDRAAPGSAGPTRQAKKTV